MKTRHYILLLLCVVVASLSWLAGTTGGARFALGVISRAVPARIETGPVEGCLASRLSIGHADIRWKDGGMRIEGMRLSWRPWTIFFRGVQIQELSASRIEIEGARREAEPFTFQWPGVPSYLSWLEAKIANLRIGSFCYRKEKEQVFEAGPLAAGITWRFGRLRLSRLRLAGEGTEITGNVEAGLTRPSLDTELLLVSSGGPVPAGKATLRAKLSRKKGGAMAGPLDVALSLSAEKTLHLQGHVSLAGSRLQMSGIRIRQDGREGTIEADGSVELAQPYEGRLSLSCTDLDLSEEVASLKTLSGTATLGGTLSEYHGEFHFANKSPGLTHGSLSGTWTGSMERVAIEMRDGAFLGGSIRGQVRVAAEKDVRIRTSLSVRKCNPGVIAEEWHGSVNADLDGEAVLAGGRIGKARVKAAFLKSIVRDKPLTGVVEANWHGNTLAVTRLNLRGEGFDLAAHGALGSRIDYEARVRDLGLFLPEARGSFRAAGWGRWKDGRAQGTMEAVGRSLSFQKLRAASVEAHIGAGSDGSVRGRLKGSAIEYGSIRIKSLSALLAGTEKKHTLTLDAVWPDGKMALGLAGSYAGGTWTGEIRSFTAREKPYGDLALERPATLSFSRDALVLGPLGVSGAGTERLDITADLGLKKLQGHVSARWKDIQLGRANALLPASGALSGRTSGSLGARWHEGKIAGVTAEARASGSLEAESHTFKVPTVAATLRWDKNGLASSMDIGLSPSGRVSGSLSSEEEVRPGLPRSARFSFLWQALDLKMTRAFLPPAVALEGSLSGSAKGVILPDLTVDARAETRISDGLLTCRTEHGVITARLGTAKADLAWKKDRAHGEIELELAGHGRVHASLAVPLRAGLPPSIDKSGPVRLSLTGTVREKGLLAAFFPGMVNESHGRLEVRARASGTLDRPGLMGTLTLSDAGAFLPGAGITLKDVAARVDFTEKELTLASLRIGSGKGGLEGKGVVRLSHGRPDSFEGTLKGKDFQAVYLPELRVKISPDLKFSGTTAKLVVRGSIAVPEASLQIRDTQAIGPSEDVRVVDRTIQPPKPLPFAVDAAVNIVLGEKITVAAKGIDATLRGSVLLAGTSPDDIRASGKIEVAKGAYSTYGVRLEIERGNIVFTGGPVESGTLDVLAVRTVTEIRRGEIRPVHVKAGVTVTGQLKAPAISLYSSPGMADKEILSYMVFGGPFRENASDAARLLQVADALLPKGKSSSFKDKLQDSLGIDTLGIETMPGEGSASQSMLAVGKYITPRLYVSLGRALLSDEILVITRFTLTKGWELASQTGTQSGLGLYYAVEFD